jgi:hypothetical protein
MEFSVLRSADRAPRALALLALITLYSSSLEVVAIGTIWTREGRGCWQSAEKGLDAETSSLPVCACSRLISLYSRSFEAATLCRVYTEEGWNRQESAAIGDRVRRLRRPAKKGLDPLRGLSFLMGITVHILAKFRRLQQWVSDKR